MYHSCFIGGIVLLATRPLNGGSIKKSVGTVDYISLEALDCPARNINNSTHAPPYMHSMEWTEANPSRQISKEA